MLLPSAASAQEDNRPTPEAAKAHIQFLGNKAIEVLRQDGVQLEVRERNFRELLRAGFNMRYIGFLVLGKNRRKVSDDELTEFFELFSEFVLIRYSKLLGGYTDEKFEVVAAKKASSKDVAVQSQIKPQRGDPIRVDWIVRLSQGEPKIIDVRIENISMVVAQRDEFNAIFRRGGMQALLQSLRAQLESLPAEGPA